MRLGESLRKEFGSKLYKLPLDIGCTCPNRDGKAGTGGCIFCSAAGSGDFAEKFTGRQEELGRAKARLSGKIDMKTSRYIAYFQSFSNTYGQVSRLEPLFSAALNDPQILALDIATRPDCLDPDILEMLYRLGKRAPLYVELGLQTIHPATARFINRGYGLPVYDKAVEALNSIGARTVTHLLFGLPYISGENERAGRFELTLESREMMLDSVKYVAASQVSGVKFHVLLALRGTRLGQLYSAGLFPTLSREEYVSLIADALPLLPESTVIHRLLSSAPDSLLLGPLWTRDRISVMNELTRRCFQ